MQTRLGRITVLDRAGLEAAACECYQAPRAEYERLLGPTPCGRSGLAAMLRQGCSHLAARWMGA